MTWIAHCGIDCSTCPAFRATQADDQALRAATAEEWSKRYGASIAADMIYCDGCRQDGQKFDYCLSSCEVRRCGVTKGVANCSVCDEYVCERLGTFLKTAPELQEALEALRHGAP